LIKVASLQNKTASEGRGTYAIPLHNDVSKTEILKGCDADGWVKKYEEDWASLS